ncbi:uncharacterized protein EDB91DRAFT_1268026 [Suillus paluster]|uniref:uncharacterized protein n=1 Tax=Suillus paluster TaxID=48578 RepID=UPI001B8726DB|nr:uncharacterized protein EDB91DRAFT_1268026 [Suillus paluster]KAG1724714.1 hypothetical protein EDB91DRAFT_1268026 [Suillus paluster]
MSQTLVIYNDDILSDEASWIKDIKLSDDERTFHEEYATAHPTHAQDEHNVDTLPPFVPLHPSSSLVSMPLDLPTFASDASVVVHNNNFLFDEAEHEYDIDTLPPFFPFHTSSSPVSQSMSLDLPIFASTCNHEPACTTPDKHEHHGDFNILPVTTTAIDKPKATHSPRSDQKSLSDKLRSARQQKRKLQLPNPNRRHRIFTTLANTFHHNISHPPASLRRTEAPPPSQDKPHRPREPKRMPHAAPQPFHDSQDTTTDAIRRRPLTTLKTEYEKRRHAI